MKNSIEKVVLSSAVSAFHDYYEMTGKECWVNETPEYWYSSNIARALKKKIPEFNFFLENPVREFREYSNANPGRPQNSYRSSGKSDISIWKHDLDKEEWEAISIIEIKRAWGWKKKEHSLDIGRICSSLLESTSVETGYFVVLTDADGQNEKMAKENVKKKTKRAFYKQIREYLISNKHEILDLKCSIKFSKFCNLDTAIAAALVFKIFKIETNQTAAARLEK